MTIFPRGPRALNYLGGATMKTGRPLATTLCKIALAALCAVVLSRSGSGLAVEPKPPTLYVANYGDATLFNTNSGDNDQTISMFVINGKGNLGPLPSHKTARTGENSTLQDITIVRGKFAYVTDLGMASEVSNSFGLIYSFLVDPYHGGLDPNGSQALGVPPGDCPYGVRSDYKGRYLYVSDFCQGEVLEYGIARHGILHPLAGSPLAATSASSLGQIASSPKGGFIYIADFINQGLQSYSVGDGGALTALGLAPSPGDCPSNPGGFCGISGVTVDPSGSFVYALDDNVAPAAVVEYSIGGSGALTLVGATSSNVTCPLGAAAVKIKKNEYLYVADSGAVCGPSIPSGGGGPTAGVAAFAIESSGTLSPIGLAPTFDSAHFGCPRRVAVAPNKSFVYTTDLCLNDVISYQLDRKGKRCGTPGCLEPVRAAATINDPVALVTAP
jgi:DNA-binding beta-propeller fold protein YncE